MNIKLLFLTIVFGLSSTCLLAQNLNADSLIAADEVFNFVDFEAEFPGGEDKLMQFLSKNIKYPKQAIKKKIQGRVSAQFVVNQDGSITDINIVKGIGAGCDEETIRVIQLMPHWKPAKLNGKAVKSYYTLPISFQLN